MNHWTQRVTARRQLAELLEKQPARVKAAKLKPEDLTVLITEGRKCEAADAEQQEQLAESAADRNARAATVREVLGRESDLRDVLAAVVDDLRETHPGLSAVLSRLSFARFRLRELAPAEKPAATEGTTEEAEELRRVEKVAREDHPARLRALSQFCQALLRPGREAILDALAERDLGREELEQLSSDALTLSEAGANVIRGAEATAREAEAARVQTRKWSATRRLFRKAVSGDKDLEAKLAEC